MFCTYLWNERPRTAAALPGVRASSSLNRAVSARRNALFRHRLAILPSLRLHRCSALPSAAIDTRGSWVRGGAGDSEYFPWRKGKQGAESNCFLEKDDAIADTDFVSALIRRAESILDAASAAEASSSGTAIVMDRAGGCKCSTGTVGRSTESSANWGQRKFTSSETPAPPLVSRPGPLRATAPWPGREHCRARSTPAQGFLSSAHSTNKYMARPKKLAKRFSLHYYGKSGSSCLPKDSRQAFRRVS